MKIYYDIEKEYRCDNFGVVINGHTPVIRYKEKPVWELYFLKSGSACTTTDFSGAVAFRAAIDVDLSTSTTVICRTLDNTIDHTKLAEGKITVPINANTSGFAAATDGQERRKAFFELWGLDASSDPVFYIRFEILISGVVDADGGSAPESLIADTITRTEVMAYLRAADERQFTQNTSDSSAFHSSQNANDLYTRRRNSAAGGEWGPWESLIAGPIGSTGATGPAPVISGGSVVTLPAGSSAVADIVSTGSGAYRIDLSIPQGSDGSNGSDGVSPTVSAVQSSGGVQIVTSDHTGVTSAFLSDGSQGLPGSAGFSPSATVTQIASGAIVSITDSSGTTSATLYNGSNGSDGSNGSNGSDGTLISASLAVTSLTSTAVFSGGSQAIQVTHDAAPAALYTNLSHYYPVEKGSVVSSGGYWYIDPAPYLAYDNVSSFTSPWTVMFAGGLPDKHYCYSATYTITPVDNKTYTHTVASGETITFVTSGLAANEETCFTVRIVQPATAVSYSWQSGIKWFDGTEFTSSETAPETATGGKTYMFQFMIDADGDILGNKWGEK